MDNSEFVPSELHVHASERLQEEVKSELTKEDKEEQEAKASLRDILNLSQDSCCGGSSNQGCCKTK